MKKTALTILGLLLALLCVLLLRTFSYGEATSQPALTLPEAPAISAERAASRLAQAIRFPTITRKAGDPATDDAGPWNDLHAWLEATYPNIHAVSRREVVAGYSLLYRWAGSDTSLDPIILMAHQDVVPVNPGTESDWTRPPFAGEIVDGVIYGRGALDDKGALVAIMEAADALANTGFQPTRSIYLMFGHDEEVSGSGAAAMVDLLHARGVRAEMVVDEGFFVLQDSPLTGSPMGFIGVAEKGYVTLELTATGAGGHSSMPSRESANIRLARAIIALDEQQMAADFSKPPLSELFRQAAPEMGFVTRMAFANLWLFRGLVESQLGADASANAMIRTTTAPTMLAGSIKENVLPQRATAVVNFRIHPNDTVEDIVEHVKTVTGHIKGISVDFIEGGGIGSAASPVSPIDGRAFAVLKAVAHSVGRGAPAVPALMVGATDARWASKISDRVYRFVPSLESMDTISGFHGTNERLSVDNIGRMARGYAQMILAMDSPSP